MVVRISIKRNTHRRDDAGARDADAEFAAVRDTVLQRHGWRCVDCGWKSEPRARTNSAARTHTTLQVHHVNDDHADNTEGNLVPKCPLDHAYHHIGCDAPSTGDHEGMASRMRVAAVPWLEPKDLNLLQMAIGAAWNDSVQGGAAQAIYSLLMQLSRPVQDAWGTHHAKDFAAAMERLSASQYEKRRVDDLRLLFHPELLQKLGAAWAQDYPLLTPVSWPELVKPEWLRGD